MNKVKVINPGAATIAESLGVTDERFGEIAEQVSIAMDIPDLEYAEMLELISGFCNHPNELALFAFAFDLGRLKMYTKLTGKDAVAEYQKLVKQNKSK